MYHNNQLLQDDEKPPVYDPCLPRLPSQQMSQCSSTGQFGRQDSLAMCSHLQEADRDRNIDMAAFLETDMDINQYINVFQSLDVPAEHVDMDDNELQKAHILYDNYDQPDHYDAAFHQAHTPYSEWVPEHERQEGSAMSSASGDSRAPSVGILGVQSTSSNNSPAFLNAQQLINSDLNLVKTEPQWEREQEPSTSAASAPRRRVRDASVELQTFKPETKARKYQLKPDEEKSNPNYKLKRARNNDAVRKSRTKQKEAQQKRDSELQGLRDEVLRLTTALETAHKLIAEQKKMMCRMSGSGRN